MIDCRFECGDLFWESFYYCCTFALEFCAYRNCFGGLGGVLIACFWFSIYFGYRFETFFIFFILLLWFVSFCVFACYMVFIGLVYDLFCGCLRLCLLIFLAFSFGIVVWCFGFVVCFCLIYRFGRCLHFRFLVWICYWYFVGF